VLASRDAHREEIGTRIGELAQGVEDLTSDENLARWVGGEARALAESVAALGRLLEEGGFDEGAGGRDQAEGRLAEAQAQLLSLREKAAATEEREARRRVVVDGMLEVLRREGFVVANGFPLNSEDDPASSTLIQAVQEGGRVLTVEVEQSCKVMYQLGD